MVAREARKQSAYSRWVGGGSFGVHLLKTSLVHQYCASGAADISFGEQQPSALRRFALLLLNLDLAIKNNVDFLRFTHALLHC